MTFLQLLAWYLWRRWSPKVRQACKRCQADKGFMSTYDLEQIRVGNHWALRTCGHLRRKRSNNGISYCLGCDKVFVAKPSRLKYLASLVGW